MEQDQRMLENLLGGMPMSKGIGNWHPARLPLDSGIRAPLSLSYTQHPHRISVLYNRVMVLIRSPVPVNILIMWHTLEGDLRDVKWV